MGEWKTYHLDEVYDFASGLSKGRDEFGFGFPFLSFMDVFNNFFVPQELQQLANTSELERSRCSVKRGDVFLTRTSETQEDLGMSCVALKDYPDTTFNGFTKRLRPRSTTEIVPEYVGFYFRSPRFRAEVTSMSSVTTRASLNNEMLSALKVIAPPADEQWAIADVLIRLNEKIDLLHRQNKTLEAMAETLFRQWFVEEAEVQSDTQIEMDNLVDSVSITHKFPDPQVVFLNTSDIYLGDVLKHESENVKSLPGQAKKSICKDDILFSEIRPANGRYAYIDFDAKNYVVSTKLMVLRSKGVHSQAFVYFYLTHPMTVTWLQTLAEGRSGTFPQITFDQIRRLKISVQSKELFDSATLLCESWLQKIKFNQKQIRSLEKLRDTLLPKLMSGEVRVQYD